MNHVKIVEAISNFTEHTLSVLDPSYIYSSTKLNFCIIRVVNYCQRLIFDNAMCCKFCDTLLQDTQYGWCNKTACIERHYIETSSDFQWSESMNHTMFISHYVKDVYFYALVDAIIEHDMTFKYNRHDLYENLSYISLAEIKK